MKSEVDTLKTAQPSGSQCCHTEKPPLKDLVLYSNKITSQWKELALQLDIPQEVVNTIDINNNEIKDKCYHMFNAWLQRTVDSCWCQFALALRKVDLLDLANVIELKFIGTNKAKLVSPTVKDSFITDPDKAVSEFTTIVSLIEGILMKTNEASNVDAIKSICGYLPISSSSSKQMFTSEQLKEIDSCSSIREIFRQLRFHLRWDDHLILIAILDRLESEECEELLGKFKSKIDCQMKLEQIYKQFIEQRQEIPTGFLNMVAIVNKKYSRITKEEYDQLKCFISKHCGVEPYVLSPFVKMSSSSVLLEWIIPPTAVTHMVEMANKSKEFFIESSFLFIQISSTVILDNRQDEAVQTNNAEKTSTIRISEQIHKVISSLSANDLEATLLTLRKIFDNIIQHPNDDKYRQIKLANKKFSSKVWRYTACEELMKMSGWVVEDDHVRLREDSHALAVFQSIEPFCKKIMKRSKSTVASFSQSLNNTQFQALTSALFDANMSEIKILLTSCKITTAGRVYCADGSSLNLLVAAIVLQQIDLVKLLVVQFNVDPYEVDFEGNKPCRCIVNIFDQAPQIFTIEFLKICGVKMAYKGEGFTLLHTAAMTCCFDIVRFLVEDCDGVDVNVTSDDLRTPLHSAYLAGHLHIAEYLIIHGADVTARDVHNFTPYDYKDGDPDVMAIAEHIKNKRKIHEQCYSAERLYYFKLLNLGLDVKEVVALTMEEFPSLKIGSPAQPQHDVDRTAIIKELTEYITKRPSDADPWRQPTVEQRRHSYFI